MRDNITLKLFIIAVIGGACLIASLLVFGLIEEREGRFREVKQEIASSWGERQTLIGPVLIFERTTTVKSTVSNIPSVRAALEKVSLRDREVRVRNAAQVRRLLNGDTYSRIN